MRDAAQMLRRGPLQQIALASSPATAHTDAPKPHLPTEHRHEDASHAAMHCAGLGNDLDFKDMSNTVNKNGQFFKVWTRLVALKSVQYTQPVDLFASVSHRPETYRWSRAAQPSAPCCTTLLVYHNRAVYPQPYAMLHVSSSYQRR